MCKPLTLLYSPVSPVGIPKCITAENTNSRNFMHNDIYDYTLKKNMKGIERVPHLKCDSKHKSSVSSGFLRNFKYKYNISAEHLFLTMRLKNFNLVTLQELHSVEYWDIDLA